MSNLFTPIVSIVATHDFFRQQMVTDPKSETIYVRNCELLLPKIILMITSDNDRTINLHHNHHYHIPNHSKLQSRVCVYQTVKPIQFKFPLTYNIYTSRGILILTGVAENDSTESSDAPIIYDINRVPVLDKNITFSLLEK